MWEQRVFRQELSTLLTLAFSNNGEPYVAFTDYGNGSKASVMKFDGTNWVFVGSPGLSAGGAYETSLTFYNREPYIAYRDVSNLGKATVMKFNGTNWVNVGVAGFSAGTASDISLKFSNTNEPYVVFVDGANDDKATLMKFVNTTNTNSISDFENNIILYPNPTTDNIALQLNQKGLLEVYSIEGKLIESVNTYTTNYLLSINQYSKGMYLLKFTGSDGNIY